MSPSDQNQRVQIAEAAIGDLGPHPLGLQKYRFRLGFLCGLLVFIVPLSILFTISHIQKSNDPFQFQNSFVVARAWFKTGRPDHPFSQYWIDVLVVFESPDPEKPGKVHCRTDHDGRMWENELGPAQSWQDAVDRFGTIRTDPKTGAIVISGSQGDQRSLPIQSILD